jgi:beta-hydroxylase
MLDAGVRNALLFLARIYAHVLRRFSVRDTFVPTDHIEWVQRLEASWHVIRDELEHLRAQHQLPALIDMMPGEYGVADARWKMFIFRYFGRSIAANCALCPRTATLLDQVPGLITANFSVLEPGARIQAHCGIFAGVLRYHLGLLVPQGSELCGLRVGNDVRHWREGASLLFDDTHQHEAWNLTPQDRVVLLLDVKRPLPAPLRWLNDALISLLSGIIMPSLTDADSMNPQPQPLPASPAGTTQWTSYAS